VLWDLKQFLSLHIQLLAAKFALWDCNVTHPIFLIYEYKLASSVTSLDFKQKYLYIVLLSHEIFSKLCYYHNSIKCKIAGRAFILQINIRRFPRNIIHTSYITFIYPRIFRVVYISEYLTIIWEIDHYTGNIVPYSFQQVHGFFDVPG